ncbi:MULTISPECIES: iron ABC transporter permease [Roseobacteraceae]|uniref:FecCD family ABC transporter permease n=1 Tax=Roseobacteraceae TaxID=2854170 RepID=UPI00080AB8D7|nr:MULTISPECIES: iron ABC transporter permease [Roseobacteraceae]ANT61950.1 iron ABC transporter permease [Salipiger sp. CCB-MM3]MCA0998485.1 iron ABC transporter permease [Alloyangia pacifica]NDV98754.1 iron ABC transporter permease [Salipiger sp. PrR002]NDW55491.1 iron ABC transporter permease [Salipiger sp. PrR004]
MTAIETILAEQSRRSQRRVLLVVLLGLGALASVLLDLVSGPSGLPLDQVLRALTGLGEVPKAAEVIVWQVRLPVAVMALLVGAALSLSGAEMQTVLDNPLAEPFTLGISASAALGAGVAIVLGLAIPGIPALWAVSGNAFLFALLALGLLQLASALRGGGSEVVILLGIAVNFTAAALLALVQFVASPDALQQLVFWTMGSLVNARWEGIAVLALVLAACLPFSLAASWRLTALRLGNDQAQGFGLDVAHLRRWTLVRVSLLAAASVSMVGVIGFVGLAGPHIARMAVGEDHRFLLPASLFTGALLMSLASVASKLLVPGILLPVGIVTSLVGLPVFFALVLRKDMR